MLVISLAIGRLAGPVAGATSLAVLVLSYHQPDAPFLVWIPLVITLALAQIAHLGNARRAGPVLAPGLALANRAAVGAVLLVGGLQLLAAFFDPLARVLRIAPLSGREWLLVVTLGALPAVVVHERVAQQAIEPGDGTLPLLELSPLFQRPHIGGLEELLGEGPVAHPSLEKAQETPVVPDQRLHHRWIQLPHSLHFLHFAPRVHQARATRTRHPSTTRGL